MEWLPILSDIAKSLALENIKSSNFPHKNKAIFLLLLSIVALLVIVRSLIQSLQTDRQNLWLIGGTIGFGVLTILIYAWLAWQADKYQDTSPNTGDLIEKRQTVLKENLSYVTERLEEGNQLEIIALGFREDPGAVNRDPILPPETIISTTKSLGQIKQTLVNLVLHSNQIFQKIPKEKRLIDVFEESKQRLLVLGKPGSGKTTLLLQLAQELLHRAYQPDNETIPVFVEASTWKSEQSLNDWIVQILKKKQYGVPEKISRVWLQQGKIIPLIDGLDELGLERQRQAIQKIDNFIRQLEYHHPSLVVCCRSEEFEQGKIKPYCLEAAIRLESLSDQQIKSYLRSIDRSYIWDAISSEDMRSMLPSKDDVDNGNALPGLRSPLLLNVMLIAYEGRPFQNYTDLFNHFIQRRFAQYALKIGKPAYSDNQMQRYLGWLARKLDSYQINEFEIESLQPEWLDRSWQRWFYRCVLGCFGGLTYGLFFGLFFAMFSGWPLGLLLWLVCVYTSMFSPIHTLKAFDLSLKGIGKGLILGLRSGFIFGLLFGLIQGTYGLIGGLLGFYGGAIPGLISGLFRGFGMLILGLAVGLMAGLRANDDVQDLAKPNQGIWNTIRDSIAILIITSSLLAGLFFVLNQFPMVQQMQGLRDTLLVSLILMALLVSCVTIFPGVQHLVVRFLLLCSGNAPWNYARFLNYANELRLMQQVGGRYRFLHDLLRKHIAADVLI